MKKSMFTLAFLGAIFAGCSSKPLTITSVDYVLEAEKKIKTVYFDFDKSFVRDDQWGSDEYNYALGLKRAVAVKDALIAKGVDAGKTLLVSYGESKPTCTAKTKDCWAENRKVTFKVLP